MRRLLAMCVCVSLAFVGCGKKPVETSVKKDGNKRESTNTQKAAKPKPEGTVADGDKKVSPNPTEKSETKATPLVVLDVAGIEKLIASHQGKVVVLDAWATYCPPCMRDFHHLVDLHKQYGADKVACISLSFDYGDDENLDELKPRVQAFLDKQGATFDNIISNQPWEVLYTKFDFAAVPAVFVYGKDGKLIKRVDHSDEKDDNKPIYDRVKVLVEKLVAEENS